MKFEEYDGTKPSVPTTPNVAMPPVGGDPQWTASLFSADPTNPVDPPSMDAAESPASFDAAATGTAGTSYPDFFATSSQTVFKASPTIPFNPNVMTAGQQATPSTAPPYGGDATFSSGTDDIGTPPPQQQMRQAVFASEPTGFTASGAAPGSVSGIGTGTGAPADAAVSTQTFASSPYGSGPTYHPAHPAAASSSAASWNGGSTGNTAGAGVPPTPPPTEPVKKRSTSRMLRYISGMIALFVIAATGGYFGSTLQQNGFDSTAATSSVAASQEDGNQAVTGGAGETTAPVVQTGNIPDIVEKTAGSVVEVKTEAVQSSGFLQQYTASGAGSGVIVSEDGYIVTNHHVIAGADKITVTLKNGTSYDATLVGSDETTDLAVLKIEATDLVPAKFGDSDALRVGEMAIAIGNPLGELGGTVTNGLISALDREITIENQTMTLLQTNAAVNPGNSGGGLFNEKGELIGIVNAKTSASGIEGLGFAIPSNVAKPVIDDLIKNGYVTGRIRLGVSFVDITSEQIARQYRVSELGAYVYQVTPGSDAEQAGLKPGDLVHMIGDQKIYQSSEIKTAMTDYGVGDQMKMTIKRDGKEVPITVTFSESRPDNQLPSEPQMPQ